jgi:uncharacterized protein (TIGR03437 family)
VVTVTLTISTPPPSIQVSPTALTFSYTTGGPIPHSSLTQNFVLSSTGSAVSALVSVQGATWLKVNPSGNISVVGLLNTIAVTVDPTGLTPKVYSGTIKITSAASANQSVNVAVTLTVNAAPPRATGTWPPGLIQGSPLSTVTLVGQNFFANSTVAAAGFINSTTVTVNDGTNTATETLNIPIYNSTSTALRVAMASPLPVAQQGVVYGPYLLSAAGGTAPYTWSIYDGAMPSGLTITTGALTGTPGASSAGTYYFTLGVSDSAGAFAYMPMKLIVRPAGGAPSTPLITVSMAPISSGASGVPYTPTSLTAIGGSGSYSWTATSMPPGLVLSSAGAISGTPTSLGITGTLSTIVVSDTAMLVTVPANYMANPGLLRLVVNTPAPGGGAANDALFTVYGPNPTVTAAVNSASFLQGSISPGEIITLFGRGLGPATFTLFNPAVPAPQIPNALPATGPQTSVTINGNAAPILYTSAGQASVVVPYEVTGGPVSVVVTYNGLHSQPFTVNHAATNPGVYTVDASGRGQAAVLNFNSTSNDYTVNSANNPAARGSTIRFYVTGMGATSSPVANTLIPAPPPDVAPTAVPIAVTIGTIAAAVTSAISPPGSVPGLLQIDCTVPIDAPTGNAVPVEVTIGSSASQAGVTVAIR